MTSSTEGAAGEQPVVPRGRVDRGQSTVELALAIPFVALLALGIVQVGVIVHHRVLVDHVAREAARAAAVAGGRLGGGEVPGLRHGLGDGALEIDAIPTSDRGEVAVTVRYRDPTDVAVIGALVPPVELTATVVMRIEGPPG